MQVKVFSNSARTTWLRDYAVVVLTMAFVLAFTGGVDAQEQGTSAPRMVPPRVVSDAATIDPTAARTMRVRVTIDTRGQVVEVEVLDAPEDAWIAAARGRVAALTFAPALRDGAPITARIVYTLLVAPPAEAAAPGEQPDGSTAPTSDDPHPSEPGPDTAEANSPPATTPPGDVGEAASAPGDVPTADSPPPATDEPLEDEGVALDTDGMQVTVEGERIASAVERAPGATDVIDLDEERHQSADLGQVLARTDGVSVRRAGGLGSGARLALGGLDGAQVRLFLDGVPLRFAGFGLGVANVPVGLLDRIEVHRGVVPIHLGADALGGAIDLVSRATAPGYHASVDYQVGSFHTHRLVGATSAGFARTGFFVRANGFFDRSRNDYPITVEAADDMGRVGLVRLRKQNDDYEAGGGAIELGFAETPFARRLVLRAFATVNRREVPHNLSMTRPFGEVEYAQRSGGASLRFERDIGDVTLDTVAGFVSRRIRFEDTSLCTYDWYDTCLVERPPRGEVRGYAQDFRLYERTGYLRAGLRYVRDLHEVSVSFAPTYTRRTGVDLSLPPDTPAPLSHPRTLFTLVTGAEYRVEDEADVIANVAFFKHYFARSSARDILISQDVVPIEATHRRAGIGDALRLSPLPWLRVEASYEWATRIPSSDELFGDGALVVPNLRLRPEVSHNANLELAATVEGDRWGALAIEVEGFLRVARDLIWLTGGADVLNYDNLVDARILGVTGALRYTAPDEHATLTTNVTYQDARNVSASGPYSSFRGDRLPNAPYFFANVGLTLRSGDWFGDAGAFSLRWNTGFVHRFFRSWQSSGAPGLKLTVPTQLHHTVGATYSREWGARAVFVSFEVQNLTDARLFDFYGVQRPGRAFFVNVALEV